MPANKQIRICINLAIILHAFCLGFAFEPDIRTTQVNNNTINNNYNNKSDELLENSITDGIQLFDNNYISAIESTDSSILATKTTEMPKDELQLISTDGESNITITTIRTSLLLIENATDATNNSFAATAEVTTNATLQTVAEESTVANNILNCNKTNGTCMLPSALIDVPADCSQHEKLHKQPVSNGNSSWRKCCPFGESLNIYRENQTEDLCMSSPYELHPKILEVALYENCIENLESSLSLRVEIGNPCNGSYVLNSDEDRLYVVQDGSLLVMDQYANESYAIETSYCLDFDANSSTDQPITFAIICITAVEEHLNRSQIVTVSIFMLLSIPCLWLLSYLHVRIKELRTLHGLSLACMSFSLGTGYAMYALANVFNMTVWKFGYVIQFFLLSYFVWFFCICCNSCINIWYKFPHQKCISKSFQIYNLAFYILICVGLPLIFVVMAIQKGFPGMPSYFVQGFTESIRESQRYFIPPISGILFLCFLLIVTSFFGFQRFKKIGTKIKKSNNNIYTNITVKFDMQKYEEIKKDAKCISLLWLVMVVTWLLEIITFYLPGPENYLLFMEILNGLQGIFVLLIFVVVRRRRSIILRWWYDRGTHNIEQVEMRTLNTSRNANSSNSK